MWQYVVQQWVRQHAQSALSEALSSASNSAQQQPDALAAPPPPADIAMVCALSMEAGGIVDKLDGVLVTKGPGFTVRQGGWRGRNMVVVESGVGREAARQATEAVIVGHHPTWVLSIGFAGALQPNMARGDIVIADRLVAPEREPLTIDFKWQGASPAGVHVGTFLTLDKIVRLPAEKKALGEQHHALAVDMETIAVAEACQQARVKFMAVRVISDTVDDELPADLEKLIQERTLVGQLGAAAKAIWQRPGSIKDLWNLQETALVTSDRLAKFLAGMWGQLVPAPVKSSSEGE